MAVQGEDELAALFEDGTVMLGRATPSSAQRTLRLPSHLEPLDICWLGSHETCVSTASSRLLFLDSRAPTVTDTLIMNSRAEAGKQLRIRTLDHDPLGSPDWLLCTGDDEASVRLWDRRNLSQVLAESLPTARRAITSVRMHRAIPNTILSGSVDGSVVQHQVMEGGGSLIEEVWEMPSTAVPVAVNSLEMLGSLAVAALDNATVLAWRS
jgi:WD40 repeat protein